ncbi:(+)-neomenthol dehydrogenase [Mycena indigotica]|uniref:(+)-neomenthol dehydrogenase n=1 Tax=Mycena indigotica TaxID=2126181 RepID=A0A8H6SBI0_9AGAR|nr:(+)-neomenthol dehydrogenase [Mycena indigotica]KAF7295706.1 (+)-neomenthol dehydrogenase [Mycena indigotica]
MSKVILVTGSNAGIGFSLVQQLAAKGHTVYVASRKEDAGNEAVAKIKAANASAAVKLVQLDVTDSKSIAAAVQKITSDEGKLNVLVNNAGVADFTVQHNASTPNLDAVRTGIETNLIGLMAVTSAFLPLLRKAHTADVPSVILNVSTGMASNTVMSSFTLPAFVYPVIAYNTSKAAANSYTVALAFELRDEGIKVNTVSPGFTATKLNGFAAGGKTIEEGAAVLLPWCLLGKDGATGKFADEKGELPW